METYRLFNFLTSVLFFSVLVAGCEKNTEEETSFYDVELPGTSPVEIDEVKCFLSLNTEEITNAAYDPQGFTLRLPSILPESSLVEMNETIPTAIISDPQTKWQLIHFECYRNGELTSVILSNGSDNITYRYVYADRSVTINGQHSEDVVLNTPGDIKPKVSINHNWADVTLKKGWNLVTVKTYLELNSVISQYYFFDNQENSIIWCYSYRLFDMPFDYLLPPGWKPDNS